jgi:eukaryotic-like serine/threonine-protein kinase
MNPERDRYEALLESLADGADVDWAALETASTTSAERRRYRNLRLVARVAELHRTLTLEDDDLFAPADHLRDVPTGPPSVWGHLQVRDRIASGAYGEIYVAHDPNLKRDVALKILRHGAASGRSLEQLLTEARTLARVHHANVVTIHGADVRDGRAGLWMELVHGQTLESWLDKHGLMGSGEVSAAGIDVCRALAAVHGAGLVHGDIKAQNVMRESGGRIVLMDFGAGRAQGADTVGVAGTPLYLAPEVLAGEPPSPRSDIYSVGVLLFHLLTGAYPCDADDLESLRAPHPEGRRLRQRVCPTRWSMRSSARSIRTRPGGSRRPAKWNGRCRGSPTSRRRCPPPRCGRGWSAWALPPPCFCWSSPRSSCGPGPQRRAVASSCRRCEASVCCRCGI